MFLDVLDLGVMLFNDPAILVRVCLGYKRSLHLRRRFWYAPSGKEKGDANVGIQELQGKVILPPADGLYIHITNVFHIYIYTYT